MRIQADLNIGERVERSEILYAKHVIAQAVVLVLVLENELLPRKALR
jgi:hypothetical protein